MIIMIKLSDKKRYSLIPTFIGALIVSLYITIPLLQKIQNIVDFYEPVLNETTPTLKLHEGGIEFEGHIPQSITSRFKEINMADTKKAKQMKVLQTAVNKGYGSTRPTVQEISLPTMDKPHLILFFRGEEFDLYAVMSESVARNLREELNINLK